VRRRIWRNEIFFLQIKMRAKNEIHTTTPTTWTVALNDRVEMGQQLNTTSIILDIISAPLDAIVHHISPLSITLHCAHSVKLGGLCGVCGSDISLYLYTFLILSDSSNDATININHTSHGLLISPFEAARLERSAAERLLTEKKLLLILDLDQTLLHATVEPLIGEWRSDPESDNFGILKDVAQFKLPPSSLSYYIKLRPGTRAFLARLSELFEMHIYTMGTRPYGMYSHIDSCSG
jgi:RNA polymerase II subunit A-like phosphatase